MNKKEYFFAYYNDFEFECTQEEENAIINKMENDNRIIKASEEYDNGSFLINRNDIKDIKKEYGEAIRIRDYVENYIVEELEDGFIDGHKNLKFGELLQYVVVRNEICKDVKKYVLSLTPEEFLNSWANYSEDFDQVLEKICKKAIIKRMRYEIKKLQNELEQE